MALEEFKLRAAIDRVQLTVHLDAPSQFRHFKARLPSSWVTDRIEPCEGERPESCLAFSFWLQDPPAPGVLANLLALSVAPSDVAITGIEVALDAYLRKPPAAPGVLAGAVLHLLRCHAHPPCAAARIAMDGKATPAHSKAQMLTALQSGFLISRGTRQHSSKGYVKTTDTAIGACGTPQRIQLPPEEHRARMEMTLTGERCPFTTLSEWKHYNFGDLATRHLAMLQDRPLPSPRTELLRRLRESFWMGLGRPLRPPGTPLGPSRRRSLRGTGRDSRLNDRIRKALRELNQPPS